MRPCQNSMVTLKSTYTHNLHLIIIPSVQCTVHTVHKQTLHVFIYLFRIHSNVSLRVLYSFIFFLFFLLILFDCWNFCSDTYDSMRSLLFLHLNMMQNKSTTRIFNIVYVYRKSWFFICIIHKTEFMRRKTKTKWKNNI